MKVKLSFKIKVDSFEGFSTKSLVYSEIFSELGVVLTPEGYSFGDRLVCPNDSFSLTVVIDK